MVFELIEIIRKDENIKDYFIPRIYKKDEIIFDEGDISNSLYIIEKGSVIVEKAIDREKRNFKDLGIISEGEFLGEMTIFENVKRTARARALTEVECLEITDENFLKMINLNKDFAIKILSEIIKLLSLRLSHTSRELTLLYDISKELAKQYTQEREFITSLIDELSFYFYSWEMEAYLYNRFNNEFEKIKELDKEKNFNINLYNYNTSMWIDNSKYLMVLKSKGTVYAKILFVSDKELSKKEINDFTTIFNTIYFIASNGIETTLRNADEAFLERLKKKKGQI